MFYADWYFQAHWLAFEAFPKLRREKAGLKILRYLY